MRPIVLAWLAAALAAPAPEGLGGGTTDKFEVLDLSVAKGWAVVKLVEHDPASGDGYFAGSVDCSYAGMTATPTAGVTLATWDLGAGRVGEAFVVYAKVAESSECTPLEASQKSLADAKAAAAAKGLDVTRKPSPIAPKNGTFTLTVGAKTVTVTQTHGVREDEEGMEHTSWTRLAVGGTTLHEVEATYNPMGAGRLSLTFTQAYVEGDKVVFVLERVSGNMRSSDSTSWALTPPLAIGG